MIKAGSGLASAFGVQDYNGVLFVNNVTKLTAIHQNGAQIISMAYDKIICTDGVDTSSLTKSSVNIGDAVDSGIFDKHGVNVFNALAQIILDNVAGLATIEDIANSTFAKISNTGYLNLKGNLNAEASDNIIRTARKSLTAAQIKTLNSVPVQIAPAIAGKTIQVISAAYNYTFGTLPFTNNTVSLFASSLSVSAFQALVTLLLAVASRKGLFGAGNSTLNTLNIGDALMIGANADSAVGDGTLVVDVMFRYIDAF